MHYYNIASRLYRAKSKSEASRARVIALDPWSFLALARPSLISFQDGTMLLNIDNSFHHKQDTLLHSRNFNFGFVLFLHLCVNFQNDIQNSMIVSKINFYKSNCRNVMLRDSKLCILKIIYMEKSQVRNRRLKIAAYKIAG